MMMINQSINQSEIFKVA